VSLTLAGKVTKIKFFNQIYIIEKDLPIIFGALSGSRSRKNVHFSIFIFHHPPRLSTAPR